MEGGFVASVSEATPLVRYVPKIVMILPGATLPEDREAAFTTRRFWAGRVLEITHNHAARRKVFTYPPLTWNGLCMLSLTIAIVWPTVTEVRMGFGHD